MSKTIKQLAEELGISKTAVMKYIDTFGLRSQLTKKGNSFVVDEQQELSLKNAYANRQPKSPTSEAENANRQPKSPTSEAENANRQQELLIDSLQTHISDLQIQLSMKDEQIRTLTAALQSAQDQQAVLTATLRASQEAQARLADSLSAEQALHAGTIQTQLVMHPASSVDEPARGFWQKLFGWMKK